MFNPFKIIKQLRQELAESKEAFKGMQRQCSLEANTVDSLKMCRRQDAKTIASLRHMCEELRSDLHTNSTTPAERAYLLESVVIYGKHQQPLDSNKLARHMANMKKERIATGDAPGWRK